MKFLSLATLLFALIIFRFGKNSNQKSICHKCSGRVARLP